MHRQALEINKSLMFRMDDNDVGGIASVLGIFADPSNYSYGKHILAFFNGMKYARLSKPQIDEFRSAATETGDAIEGLVVLADVFAFERQELENFQAMPRGKTQDGSEIAVVYHQTLGFLLQLRNGFEFQDLDRVLECLFLLHSGGHEDTSFLYAFVLEQVLGQSKDCLPAKTVALVCAHMSALESSVPKSLYVLLRMLERVEDVKEERENKIAAVRNVLLGLVNVKEDIDTRNIADIIERQMIRYSGLAFGILRVFTERGFDEEYARLVIKAAEMTGELCERMKIPVMSQGVLELARSDQDETVLLRPRNISVEDVVGLEIVETARSIAILLTGKVGSQYVTMFFDSLGSPENSAERAIMTAFMGSFVEVQWTPPPQYIEIMYNKVIFDPDMSMWIMGSDMAWLSIARQMIIYVLGRHCSNFIVDFFGNFVEYPVLFAEIIFRSVDVMGPAFVSDRFMRMFIDTEMKLQEICFDEAPASVQNVVWCNSKSFVEMMSQGSIRGKIMRPELIADDLFSIMTRQVPRDLTVSRIKSLLSNHVAYTHSTSNGVLLIENLCSIFSYVSDKHAVDGSVFVKDVLSMFVNASTKNETLSRSAGSLLGIASKSLGRFRSHDFLCVVLDLIGCVSERIDDSVYVSCAEAMKDLKGAFSKHFTRRLFAILARPPKKARLFDLSPNMSTDTQIENVISRPGILPLIFSYFARFSRLKRFFAIMNVTCDQSTLNRIKLHDGEFDICLIQFLTVVPHDIWFKGIRIRAQEEVDVQLVAAVLLKIFSARSSLIVAQKLVGLTIYSPISADVMAHVLPFNLKLLACSRTCWPIGLKDVQYAYNGISVKRFESGSTIVMKCFADDFAVTKKSMETVVCRVAPLFTIVIRGLWLICRTESTDVLLADLVSDRWNVVIMSFERMQSAIQVTMHVNANPKSIVKIQNMPKGTCESMTFTVGNVARLAYDVQSILAAYHISVIGYYESVLGADDRRRFSAAPINVPGVEANAVFVLSGESGFPPGCTDSGCCNYPLPDLFHVMRQHFPIGCVVPAFESIDKITNVACFLQCMKAFFGSKVSSIVDQISILLPRNDSSYLTFDLYMSLYDWMDVMTDQCQFFDLVLFQFDIWMRGTASNVEKIVNHWLTELVPKHMDLFKRPGLLLSVLTDIRRYLYCCKDAEVIACEFARDPLLDPCAVRDKLFEIIHATVETAHTSEDVGVYPACLVTCKDAGQVEGMLAHVTSLLESMNAAEKGVKLLHCIDIGQFPKLLPQMIRILDVGAHCHFYEESILLSCQFSKGIPVTVLLSEFQQRPRLFAVCLMSAVRANVEHKLGVMAVLDNFTSSSETLELISGCRFWMMWPILFALQTTDEVQTKMCVFIGRVINMKRSFGMMTLVLAFLDIIDVMTSIDTEAVRCSIAREVLSVAFCEKTPQSNLWALECGFRVLYLKCVLDTVSPVIKRAWNDSPFCFGDVIEEDPPKTSEISSHTDLKNALAGIDDMPIQYIMKLPVKITDIHKCAVQLSEVIDSLPRGLPSHQVLHKLLICVNEYPRKDRAKKDEILVNLSLADAVWTSYVIDIKDTVLAFANELCYWLLKQDDALSSYSEVKESISDPTLEVLKRRKSRAKRAKAVWKNNVLRFVNERRLFSHSCFVWKRDNHFTSNYTAVTVKRSLGDQWRIRSRNVITEPYRASFSCMRVKIGVTTKCECRLSDDELVLVSKKVRRVRFDSVDRILFRNRGQIPSALELFMVNGRSILLDFAPTLASDVVDVMKSANLRESVFIATQDYGQTVADSGILQKWCSGEISNYDFLLELNMLTGRTTQDAENYVIFPWILLGEGHRRRLDLPIAVQSDSRIQEYCDHVSAGNDDYVFGCAPSNAMLLSFYFLRLEPFTKLHLHIHDGRYDCHNRMFTDFETFMNNVKSAKECKESCPEFYTFPEIFMSLSDDVGPLVLPDGVNIFDFVYTNRVALESDEVSEHLNEWIDLVFGVCQQGHEAVEKCNVFLPQLRSTVWESQEFIDQEDVVVSILRNLGSLPPVVFAEHVPRRNTPVSRCIIARELSMGFDHICDVAIMSKRGEVSVFIFMKDGTISRFCGFIDDGEWCNNTSKITIPDDSEHVVCGTDIIIFSHREKFVGLLTEDDIFSRIETKFVEPDFIVACLSRETKCVYFASRSGLVQQMSVAGLSPPTDVLQTTCSLITAVTVSRDFGVFVCGTSDDYLEVHSLDKGRLVKSHFVGSTISDILITPSMGFIVVKTDREIWLFTVNGTFMKRILSPLIFGRWVAFKNQQGLDFICCAEIDGRVLVFEAYFPDRMTSVVQCPSPVLAIEYDGTTNVIIVVTAKSVNTIPINC